MKHIEVVFSSDIICFQILVQQQELLVPCHLLCALEMGTLLFQLEAELWSAQSPLLLTTPVLWLVHIYCEALFWSISFSFLSCLFGGFWFGFFFFWVMENVLNCCTFGEETVFSFLLEELLAQVNPLLAGHSVATQLPVIYISRVLLAFLWSFVTSCATLNPDNRPCEPHS